MPKEHRINLRLSESEYTKLQAAAGEQRLASYCREALLNAKKGGRKSRVPAKTIYRDLPPELLRELNAIGNNLNQIARLGNVARRRHSLELLQLTEALRLIKGDLEELLETIKANHAR